MVARRIRITTQPYEGQPEVLDAIYEDTPCVRVEDACGGLLDLTSISAWQWAFDAGYSLADKGPFIMVELDMKTGMPLGLPHPSYKKLTKEMKTCT